MTGKNKLMTNPFISRCLSLFCRGWILYVLAFVLISLMVNPEKVINRSRIMSLNRIRPLSFSELVRISEQKLSPDPEKLEQYRFYYENVSEVVKDQPDALGLQAYCYYRLGDLDEAARLYRKAIKDNPHFFWFYYNLGVLYSQKGDHKKAIENFSLAIEQSPQVTLNFIVNSSRLYMPLVAEQGDPKQFLVDQLRRGIRNCHLFQAWNYMKLQDHQNLFKVANLGISKEWDDDGVFSYYAGLAAYEMGEYGKSIPFLQASIRKDPQAAETYQCLGQVLKALGKNEMAGSALSKAGLLRKSQGNAFLEPQFRLELY